MLPSDAKQRKETPIYSGLLMYFPKTAAAVAKLSVIGNEQHNPGEPLRWAREKSTDQHDTLIRHAMEAGSLDSDRVPHDVKVAWRSFAACELYLEENPWTESVEAILAFIAEQKKPGKFDHCPDSTTFVPTLEPIDSNALYCVCFRDKDQDGALSYVSYKGPFPDMWSAEEYARLNPHNIAGLKTIHALNRL